MATFYDILLDSDGDLPAVTTHTRGWLAVVQRVVFRLNTFEGEWLLDTAVGLPFLRWRAQKNPNIQEISTFLQDEILAVPGVIRIVSFQGRLVTAQERMVFDMALEVEDVVTAKKVASLTFFPFGPTTANTNPIALITGPSKTVL